MAKKIAMTTEKLAGMTRRGFTDVNERMDRGFAATERSFSEISQVMQVMLKRLERIDENVSKLNEIEGLKRRLEKLEARS